MIRLKNVSVRFQKGTPLEHDALRNVSVDIGPGEFVCLIGSNGAGKSTLLNVISGDVVIDSGQVLIDERDMTREPPEKRAALISRVFQDPASGTFAQLSIEENLALARTRGASRGLGGAINRLICAQFASLLAGLNMGLESRLRDPVGALSGGQRQALSLLMATLKPAKLLLLDEHTAALDPKMAQKVLALTENIVRDQNLATLMITHNMTHALSQGDRCLVMHQGEIVHDLKGPERDKLGVVDLMNLMG